MNDQTGNAAVWVKSIGVHVDPLILLSAVIDIGLEWLADGSGRCPYHPRWWLNSHYKAELVETVAKVYSRRVHLEWVYFPFSADATTTLWSNYWTRDEELREAIAHDVTKHLDERIGSAS